MAKPLLSFLKSQPRFDLESSKRSNLFLFVLIFVLLGSFLVHNFDSIGQDIGRHLKVGEIIWQTKEVPKTNLFSFTEPDFKFTNHHWLSEVIFYGVFNLGGFTGLILLKTVLVLVAFLLLFFIFSTRSDLKIEKGRTLNVAFWPLITSFLLSIFIFISRTEVRPEIFSFLILAFFLFVLFREKYPSLRSDLKNPQGRTLNWLWFLPLLELFWVNLHIYFFIGPLIFLFFLIDRLVNKKINTKSEALNPKQAQNSKPQIKKLFVIFSLILLATLANPAGIQGALLPFNILKEYGYSIVENQTLAFLADFFGFNLPIFVFKVSVGILIVSLLLTIKNLKNRIFEVLISAFVIYAGFKMLRNLPLYALASFPVLAILLSDVLQRLNLRKSQGSTLRPAPRSNLRWFNRSCLLAVTVFLIFIIFFVASGGYYKKAELSKAFGFSVPNGLERATDFVKENNIEGPMFNNFDIGGYLIWQLPEHKVFVDNRPEAYSVEFFSETYKPMQESPQTWEEFSERYGINFIFFGHTDRTPWGQTFLQNIIKDSNWRVVFINENVIILVKNIAKNQPIFSKYKYELTK